MEDKIPSEYPSIEYGFVEMAHRIFEISDKADPLSAEIFRGTPYSDNGQQDVVFAPDFLYLYSKIEIDAIGTYIVLFPCSTRRRRLRPNTEKLSPLT